MIRRPGCLVAVAGVLLEAPAAKRRARCGGRRRLGARDRELRGRRRRRTACSREPGLSTKAICGGSATGSSSPAACAAATCSASSVSQRWLNAMVPSRAGPGCGSSSASNHAVPGGRGAEGARGGRAGRAGSCRRVARARSRRPDRWPRAQVDARERPGDRRGDRRRALLRRARGCREFGGPRARRLGEDDRADARRRRRPARMDPAVA
jgi:hypothetical protein